MVFACCSAVHRWGLCCVAVLMAWLWLVLCCRCGGRPSVRLAVVVAVVGLFGVFCVRCPHLCYLFPLPLPFWGVLLPFLAVFGGGAVCLLVRCFSWLVAVFVGFARWLPLLLACRPVRAPGTGPPRPYFGASEWGSDYPLKISEKKFSPNGVWSSGGFPRNIIY